MFVYQRIEIKIIFQREKNPQLTDRLILNGLRVKFAASECVRVNSPLDQAMSNPLEPTSILNFFSYPDPYWVLSLPPASSDNPGRFTYRHFASGNFHCFAGLVNPYWGLPEPPPASHPGIHTGARFPHPLSAPHRAATLIPSPFPSLLVTSNTISTLASRPSPPNQPLFPATPPEREKLAASRPGSGLGCFLPHR